MDKDKFRRNIHTSFKQFYYELVDEWSLDIGYSTFMNLLDNKTNWLLIYAYAISRKCNVPIDELFVEVSS